VSPATKLLGAGLTLIATRFALGLAGGEDAVSVISGTICRDVDLFLGPAYLLAHLGALIAAPPLLAAGVLRWFVAEGRRSGPRL
jgi:hypothetical protein